MMKKFSVAMFCVLLGNVALAAPTPKATTPATAKEASAPVEATTVATQTDVIGSKEAPGVFNIVPWKDKAVVIPKKEVSTSILRETLQPLDRDVLRREIQLQQSLSKE